ncbi:efflux pump, RND superfamily, putative [Syntrophotalea carbinolica DSM 2380]|uniref:Efflux pump, RND superfamily, putative n=1 Tax=Syntrophotalea carbinolica (strain DSM 2380 / NBRC 103641 / GraBd1) TaxID=338963 RepID=Q3A2T5_SYNC1|nr:MMPL family transporter [Syntrophotalea carbinolica]ABA89322.1 efflux pump, RND superfamily, putative [Syntrophotalea carbinolica DSM 2380]
MFSRIQEKCLTGLWRFISRAPRTIVWCAVLLAAVAALVSVLFLRLDSDQDKLVSQDLPYQQRYLEVLRNFGDQEYLYVVVQADEGASGKRSAERFAEALATRLGAYPDQIQEIHYRITAQDLGPGALYFASLDEAQGLTDMVGAIGPLATDWLHSGKLPDLIERVSGLFGGGRQDGETADPSLLGPALEGLDGFVTRIDQTLAGEPAEGPVFDVADRGVHYFFTANERLLIMRLLPVKDYSTMDVIAGPLATVREALQQTRAEFPAIQAGLTGRPVLQADEMVTTNRDMMRASILSVILVGLLFTLVLHGWLRPVLVIFCLVLALAMTFGFTTVTLGVLNLLSIVFALVLVGIGVDFGVHVVMRYVEERKAGNDVEDAVRISLMHTGPGVILGAITSVCAFYAVVWSDFTGLAELGLIGGTGILLCLVVMLTVLPALLLMAGRRNLFPKSMPQITTVPLIGRLSARPGRLLTVVVLVTLLLLPGLFKVRFNYNLLELQAEGLESVRYEKRMIEDSDESTWYAVSVANDVTQLNRLREQFKALDTVGKTESLSDYLPQNQQRKAALFRQAAARLGNLPTAPGAAGPVDAQRMLDALDSLSGALDNLAEKLFAAGAGDELAQLDALIEKLDSAYARLADNRALAARLTPLQTQLQADVSKGLRQLQIWLSASPVGMDELPAFLRGLYVGRDGAMQIKVVPSQDIWKFKNLRTFVADLRKVDAQVTGVPISVFESARLMKHTFVFSALLTLVLVSLLLWFNARSMRYILLALLPLSVGMIWLLSLMGWLGLNFNLANFFAIPILIAIGVDGGVHFLARWKELGNGCLFQTSTPMAVTLSFATTMIGFGGLLFAHHRGLASLGWVMVLGSLTGMLSCLLVLPAVLKVIRYGANHDKE